MRPSVRWLFHKYTIMETWASRRAPSMLQYALEHGTLKKLTSVYWDWIFRHLGWHGCGLASRLGTQQLTWHAYEGQTSQQVRSETAEIQSGIPRRKQQLSRTSPRRTSGRSWSTIRRRVRTAAWPALPQQDEQARQDGRPRSISTSACPEALPKTRRRIGRKPCRARAGSRSSASTARSSRGSTGRGSQERSNRLSEREGFLRKQRLTIHRGLPSKQHSSLLM